MFKGIIYGVIIYTYVCATKIGIDFEKRYDILNINQTQKNKIIQMQQIKIKFAAKPIYAM